jgi:hypothetical protein
MTSNTTERAVSKEQRWKHGTVVDSAAPLILGFVAYSVAAVSTFSIPQLTHVGLDAFAVAGLTFVAGLFAIALRPFG